MPIGRMRRPPRKRSQQIWDLRGRVFGGDESGRLRPNLKDEDEDEYEYEQEYEYEYECEDEDEGSAIGRLSGGGELAMMRRHESQFCLPKV